MKKIALFSLFSLAFFVLAALIFFQYQRQNEYISFINSHQRISVNVNKKQLDTFLNGYIPKNSKVITDNKEAQLVNIESVKHIQIILTDQIQDFLVIKHGNNEKPMSASNIEIAGETLIITIYINEDYLEDDNGNWLLSSLLTHTILFIRDVTKSQGNDLANLNNFYRENITAPEVRSALANQEFFELTRKN